jgi:signal transduction histidine kinase
MSSLTVTKVNIVKILVIDDSDYDRKILVDALSTDDTYRILEARNEAEVDEIINDDSVVIDVVLLDYDLGDTTGLNLMPKLIEKNLAVIFVAGNNASKIIIEAIRAGAYDYVVKDAKFKYTKLVPATVNNVIARMNNQRLVILQTRELQAINEELRRFAHMVSHDLKAPLRNIKSLSSFIEADEGYKISAESKENLKQLQSISQILSDMIDAVLEYSKTTDLNKIYEAVDSKELINEVIKVLGVPEHITITVAEHVPVVYMGRVHLFQIFQNLISNAIKYNDKPKGSVFISSRARSNELEYEFCVQDNGPGIDEAYFETIFQIFNTGDKEKSKDTTGVGLSIVKSIVSKYGGTVRVKSKLGQGTSFFFTAPRLKLG